MMGVQCGVCEDELYASGMCPGCRISELEAENKRLNEFKIRIVELKLNLWNVVMSPKIPECCNRLANLVLNHINEKVQQNEPVDKTP